MWAPSVAARLSLGLLCVTASGCGLVWSFEEPRDEPDASPLDAGLRDAGRSDAGGRDAGLDAGLSTDGGASRIDGDVTTPDGDVLPEDAGLDAGPLPQDAGPAPDAGFEECEATCAEDRFCDRPAGRCVGPASCVSRPPVTCTDVLDPVCGCDRNQYRNSCEAQRAGTSVLRAGDCPNFEELDWCNPSPALPPNPSGCTRCYDDDDCPSLFPLCIGSACGTDGHGVCAPYGGPGSCYYDYECGASERCVGARIRGCLASLLPIQGRCQ